MGFVREWMMAKLGRADPGTYWGKVLGNRAEGVLTISPKQEGSGEPSPENVRPIHPGLTLVRDDDSVLEVYGGELDTTSGVLTVTWTSMTVDTWGDNGTATGLQNISTRPDGKKGGLSNFSSNLFSIGAGAYKMTGRAATGLVEMRVPLNDLNVSESDASTVRMAAVGTWMAEHPTQICYEIATPVTYQLTEAEVKRARRKIR